MNTNDPRLAEIGKERLNDQGDLLLSLSGPLTQSLRTDIQDALAQFNGTTNLVVDLSRARDVDPYVLGPIVEALHRTSQNGKKVAVVSGGNNKAIEALMTLDWKKGTIFFFQKLKSVESLGIPLK